MSIRRVRQVTIGFEELGKYRMIVVRKPSWIFAGFIISEECSRAEGFAQKWVSVLPVYFEIQNPEKVVDSTKPHTDLTFGNLEYPAQVSERAKDSVTKSHGSEGSGLGNGRC